MKYLPRAMQLLRVTQERQRLGGLNMLGDQAPLDDDSYCYVVLAGGMSNLHIIVGYGEQEVVEGIERAAIPDFVSGVIQGGTIEKEFPDLSHQEDKLARFRPTEQCFWRYLHAQGEDQWLQAGFQYIKRLAVEPATEFDELKNPAENGPKFSQYVRLKPTMYSGKMRRVVQALMGFGKQRRKGKKQISLYDFIDFTADTSWPAGGDKYAKETTQHGLQIRYDWKFARTHGITAAADGRLWLVEIGVNGVLAMPLPLHPTNEKFRDWLEEQGDTDAIALLDEFGGFPTGEPFPEKIEPWIRAGKVLRLMTKEQMQPFYDHSPYSSVMGWAFNLRGDEAHNTAWRFGDDGFQRGVHYAIRIGIGAITEPEGSGLETARRMAALRGKEGVDDNDLDAVLFKIGRMTRAQLASATAGRNDIQAFNAISAFHVEPIATGTASMSKASEGFLYHPGKIGNLIKFPEPSVGLLVSHDMRAESWAQGDPMCDTVVHVFFDRNELKWVKYFRDARPSSHQSWDDHEQCMYIGTWTSHQEIGSRQMLPALYSNDIDPRVERAPTTVDTVTKGTDLGYYQIVYTDDPVRPQYGAASRAKRFLHVTTTKSVSDPFVETGVAVPFHDREAFYIAVHRSESRSETEAHSLKTLGDPWRCNTWRNFPGYTGNWVGDIHTGHWARLDPHPSGCGPVTARTVMDPGAIYGGSACSDIADNGPWCFTCDDVERMAYHIPPPALPPFASTTESTSGYEVWLVSSSGFGAIKTHEHSGTFQLWPLISPFNGDANISWDQSIYETHNAFGEAQSMRFSQNLNEGGEIKGRPNWPEMLSGALTYIGVING